MVSKSGDTVTGCVHVCTVVERPEVGAKKRTKLIRGGALGLER